MGPHPQLAVTGSASQLAALVSSSCTGAVQSSAGEESISSQITRHQKQPRRALLALSFATCLVAEGFLAFVPKRARKHQAIRQDGCIKARGAGARAFADVPAPTVSRSS